MASGHVNRISRPNTWLHRPMLLTRRKLLPTRSRPHMTQSGHRAAFHLAVAKQGSGPIKTVACADTMQPPEPRDRHATAGIYWCSRERGFRLILIETICDGKHETQ